MNTKHLKRRNFEKRKGKCNLTYYRKHISFWASYFLVFMLFHDAQILAQDITSSYSVLSEPAASAATRKLFGGTITNFGYGGPAIKFTRFNNQFAFMTGGRGAFTINKRYTIGGGGYGIANSIRIAGQSIDTTSYFKMGYGGPEFGYIFFSGRKVNIGATFLVAAGAAFCQSKPKNNGAKLSGNDFRILEVVEPSFYGEIVLNRFMRFHSGISYRYVSGSDMADINVLNMRGFSFYAGLLFGKS